MLTLTAAITINSYINVIKLMPYKDINKCC